MPVNLEQIYYEDNNHSVWKSYKAGFRDFDAALFLHGELKNTRLPRPVVATVMARIHGVVDSGLAELTKTPYRY